MPSYSQPDTARMAAQQHNNMMRFAGETATLWAYISASAGVPVAGIGEGVYSAGRTITAQFYVARGFMPNVAQHMSPAGMVPYDEFLMNSEYHPSVNDIVEYQGEFYNVDSEPFREPLIKNTWVSNLRRAGT